MDKVVGQFPIYRRADLSQLIELVQKIQLSADLIAPAAVVMPEATSFRS